MIDFKYEKSRKLTTEQICIIEDFAAQAANDGGFMNHFIFERAIFVFAAVVLYPDRKDEINSLIGEGYDIRAAFDKIVADGLADKMMKDYTADIDALLNIGNTWFDDAVKFQHSPLGLVNSINTFSGDVVSAAVEQLQKVSGGNVEKITEIADRWGLNRPNGETKAITDEEVKSTLEVVESNSAK